MIAPRLLGPVAVSALLAGCVLASPDFDDPAEGTGTTELNTSETDPSSAGTMSDSAGSSSASDSSSGGSASDSADVTSSDSTSDSGTSDSSDSDGTSSGGTTDGTSSDSTSDSSDSDSSDSDSSDSDSDSGDTTTGGVQPGTYDLEPIVSTCVLLQYQQAPYSKQACLTSADEQVPGENDLVIVDTAVGMGMGMNRRAEAFIQFMIPADYENATISSATLRIQTPQTPYVPAPEGGQLVLTEAYSEASLETNVPGTLQNIGQKKGEIPNQPVWIEWNINPELLISGQALNLALMPTNQIGVFYRKNTAMLRVVVD